MKTREEILDEIKLVIALNKEVKGKCNLALTDARSFIIHEQEKLQDCLNKEYERGMNEAWNIAREIHSDYDEFTNIFGEKPTIGDVIRDSSPLEVKEKILFFREEKERKNNKVFIGDVVESKDDNTKAIILDAHDLDSKYWIVYTENGCIETWGEDEFDKTGKYIDVDKVLINNL